MTAQPFKINIAQNVLDDLQLRLARYRWPDQDVDVDWSIGADVGYMKELVSYWQNIYDWRKEETALNKFNQFTDQIDGTKIHFIHEKSKNPNAASLLLIHGWPDSFYRFHKVVPMLKENFNVVVPSLPGFGFSDHKAMSGNPTADIFAKLMTEKLGYKKFVAASGDIGTNIVLSLALNHSDALLAIHLTDVGFPNGSEDFSTMTNAEKQFVGKCQQWWYMEGAYNMLQSTKPQTLGYGLTDSPVGFAAWVIEKFYGWSKCNNDLDRHFAKDELLTNIMIYWTTQTINSSIRTYLENTRAIYAKGPPKPPKRSDVPAAIASFPSENVVLPREWAERFVNVQRFTNMARGGHFAAWEEPELFANDIKNFLTQL